jgi:hypothetical protein
MQPMISSLITVTTTPTLLVAETANATRTIFIEPDSADVHLGGATVSTTNGLTITNGAQFQIVLPPQNSLYAVTGTGSHTVRLMTPEGDF